MVWQLFIPWLLGSFFDLKKGKGGGGVNFYYKRSLCFLDQEDDF